ncbi:MAG: TIGR04190 family B12-binding domain/radical SAM domain protein [bacterium]
MPKTDLILLHPPALYDFREEPTMLGPVSDLIPSGPVFEFYPIGFTTISDYLERHGLSVRIINVALKMLNNRSFSVEKLISSLNPIAFGIDLHWMPHVQGALALAEIVKKYHPQIPIIMGGLSASYFHEELIGNYPFLDYVVRGDSTEPPLCDLIKTIKAGQTPKDIPNVTWRGKDGSIQVNPLTHVPLDLNSVVVDYAHIMKKVIKYRDLSGYMPYQDWLNYPAAAIFSVRGCTYNCKTCGGSAYAFGKVCNRPKPAYRDPELIAEDAKAIEGILNGPIIIIGDLMQPGEDYVKALFKAIKKKKISNQLAVEFFAPPPTEILEIIADAVPKFNIEISIESHEEKVRRAFGRPYDNKSFEKMLSDAFKLDCQRFDIFFMTGLPEQTNFSIQETAKYSGELFRLVGEKYAKKVIPFISPLAPFVDPGSIVFENPERHGYKLFHKTVEEHRKAIAESPSWKYILNYETKWMSRDEIVYGTYDAALTLNRVKAEYKVIDGNLAQQTEVRAREAIGMMHKIDDLMEKHQDPIQVKKELLREKQKIEGLNASTICEKKELEWPTKLFKMNLFKVLRTLIKKRDPRILQ